VGNNLNSYNSKSNTIGDKNNNNNKNYNNHRQVLRFTFKIKFTKKEERTGAKAQSERASSKYERNLCISSLTLSERGPKRIRNWNRIAPPIHAHATTLSFSPATSLLFGGKSTLKTLYDKKNEQIKYT